MGQKKKNNTQKERKSLNKNAAKKYQKYERKILKCEDNRPILQTLVN